MFKRPAQADRGAQTTLFHLWLSSLTAYLFYLSALPPSHSQLRPPVQVLFNMQPDTDIVPTSFLEHIKSLYPSTPVDSIAEVVGCPWYLVAAVAFVSCNRPGAVPSVFLHALDELKQAQETAGADAVTAVEERKLLARRFRDSFVKSCLLCGAPRVRPLQHLSFHWRDVYGCGRWCYCVGHQRNDRLA